MITVEKPVGTFTIVAQYGNVLGVVRLIKRGPEVGYRGDRLDRDGRATVVGYYTNLLAAVHATYLAGVEAQLPTAVGRWPTGTPSASTQIGA